MMTGQLSLTWRNSARPSIPGMLISESMTMSSGSTPRASLSSASSAEQAKYLPTEVLPEQIGDIQLIVDSQDADAHSVHLATASASWQPHRELGEVADFA